MSCVYLLSASHALPLCDSGTRRLPIGRVGRIDATVEEDGFSVMEHSYSRQAVDEKGLVFRTALIVCKAFHARRCLMLYQLAFPDVSFKVCPVPCYNITKENWYKTEAGLHRVLGELARCGHQFVGDIENYLL